MRRIDRLGLRRIVVTGASGHLGAWVAALLTKTGATVTGTCGPGESATLVQARIVAAGVDRKMLRVVAADLLSDAAWPGIMERQDALIHIAAPVPRHLSQSPDALLAEARDGTRRVFAAAAAKGIRRVVATSSIMAAVYDSRRDSAHVIQETDWSAPATEPMTAYAVAKTEAEREAWRAAAEYEIELTVINPGILLGPSLTKVACASLGLVQEILSGRVTLAPRILLPVADVRDVAQIHVDALFSTTAKGERIFAIAGQIWLQDLLQQIRQLDPRLQSKPKARPISDDLARNLADAFSMLRYLRYDIGEGRAIDGSKAGALLGSSFRPIATTIRETVGFLQDQGADRLSA